MTTPSKELRQGCMAMKNENKKVFWKWPSEHIVYRSQVLSCLLRSQISLYDGKYQYLREAPPPLWAARQRAYVTGAATISFRRLYNGTSSFPACCASERTAYRRTLPALKRHVGFRRCANVLGLRQTCARRLLALRRFGYRGEGDGRLSRKTSWRQYGVSLV